MSRGRKSGVSRWRLCWWVAGVESLVVVGQAVAGVRPSWLTVVIALTLGSVLTVLVMGEPQQGSRTAARPAPRPAPVRGRRVGAGRESWPVVPASKVLPQIAGVVPAPAERVPPVRELEPLTPYRRTRAKLASALELAKVRGYDSELLEIWADLDS